jgi:DNA polymerase-1
MPGQSAQGVTPVYTALSFPSSSGAAVCCCVLCCWLLVYAKYPAARTRTTTNTRIIFLFTYQNVPYCSGVVKRCIRYNQLMQKIVWDLKSQLPQYEGDDVYDAMIAEYLLTYGRFIHAESEVLKKRKVSSLDDLAVIQREKFKALPKLQQLFSDIEMPLVKVLWRMEQNGILLDVAALQKVSVELDAAIVTLEEMIRKEMGSDINLNSSVQLGNYLAEKAGVPLARTKTGRYATNEQELAQYTDLYPIIGQLLSYRELAKLRSTYVNSLIDKVDGNGRIHTTYHQVAVNTGRLASSNPNMQNIPVSSEFGIKIKSCFVAPKGRTLLSFDYSQQELRILAHLTKEPKLLEAFQNQRDVHRITASKIFSVAYEEVTKKQRGAAKTINFGIIYGMSSFGLSNSLRITVEEADTFIKAFYDTYPQIRAFYDEYLKKGKEDGYVETLLGRRRYVFEYPGQKFIDNNMRRVLINYPIQGSAADLMKKAMVHIQKDILDKDSSVKMLLQIHDDLVFEVDDPSTGSGHVEKFNATIARIKEIMCNVYPLSVPMDVDAKIGRSWGEMMLVEG